MLGGHLRHAAGLAERRLVGLVDRLEVEETDSLAVRQDRQVDDHLMVDMLVPLRCLDDAIQGHHPAEQPILKDDEMLVLGLIFKEGTVNRKILAIALI